MPTEIEILTETIREAAEMTPALVDSMNNLVLLQMDRDLPAAYELSASAAAQAAAIGYAAGEATALTNSGLCAARRRDYPDALALYERALAIRTAMNDPAGIASVRTKMGNTKLRSGDYKAALADYNIAIELLKDSDDRLSLADLYANSGIIYGLQGSYSLALRSHQMALRTFEPLNELSRMASAYSNIGLIYIDQRNFDEALKMFQSALDIRQNLNDVIAVSDILNNIGNVLQDQHKFTEALEVHKRALALREANGDHAKIALTFCNLGNIYKELGDTEQALSYYSRALMLSEQVNDRRIMVQAYNNLGELHIELKQNTKAHQYLSAAVQLAEETGLKNQLRMAYNFLSMLHAQERSFYEAYKYQMLYSKLDREIYDAEISVQMAQMSLRHEIEQNERAAEIEKAKNAELQKANELLAVYVHRLEVSNDELNQFAHVASHDLREPLRMISSYLQLLDASLGAHLNETQKQFFSFAQDGARRMEALILDLLRLAKVDANPNIQPVSLQQIVEVIKSNLSLLLHEKNAQIITSPGDREGDALPEIMADRTQMMQLFQNLIGNGIKYNESPQPTIIISHEYSGEHMILTISDNGIGIPAEYREKAFQIFKRVPTARKYEGSGIGLAICKKIVEGMGGTISIQDNPTGGTIFRIVLPHG